MIDLDEFIYEYEQIYECTLDCTWAMLDNNISKTEKLKYFLYILMTNIVLHTREILPYIIFNISSHHTKYQK